MVGPLIWWWRFWLKFYRSRRVYLCTGGFVYTHGKKVDAFPWNQITEVTKASSLTYTIIRRDSQKVVLGDRFQSVQRLGQHIMREFERLNRR